MLPRQEDDGDRLARAIERETALAALGERSPEGRRHRDLAEWLVELRARRRGGPFRLVTPGGTYEARSLGGLVLAVIGERCGHFLRGERSTTD